MRMGGKLSLSKVNVTAVLIKASFFQLLKNYLKRYKTVDLAFVQPAAGV
jgi:hypothetical protein